MRQILRQGLPPEPPRADSHGRKALRVSRARSAGPRGARGWHGALPLLIGERLRLRRPTHEETGF